MTIKKKRSMYIVNQIVINHLSMNGSDCRYHAPYQIQNLDKLLSNSMRTYSLCIFLRIQHHKIICPFKSVRNT